MSTASDLINARRGSRLATVSDPYRVVVKRVDGSREAYEFRTLELAQKFFFGAWRKTRAGANPTGYSVAVEEHDGTRWCAVSRSVPNERQIHARHGYLTATLR